MTPLPDAARNLPHMSFPERTCAAQPAGTWPQPKPALPAASVRASCVGAPGHLPLQPQARGGPISFYSCRRNSQDFRGVFDGKPGKKSQLDDLALLRIEARQILQRVIQVDEVELLPFHVGQL